jgi:hypothetical protein
VDAGFGCRAPLAAAFGIAARCNATSSSAMSEASGVHTLPRTEPVVSAEWLHANLRDPDVKVRSSVLICFISTVSCISCKLKHGFCRQSQNECLEIWVLFFM